MQWEKALLGKGTRSSGENPSSSGYVFKMEKGCDYRRPGIPQYPERKERNRRTEKEGTQPDVPAFKRMAQYSAHGDPQMAGPCVRTKNDQKKLASRLTL